MSWRRTLVLIVGCALAVPVSLGASSGTAAVAVPPQSSPTAVDGVGLQVAPGLERLAEPQSSPKAPDAMSAPLHVTSNDLCSTVVPRVKELAAEGKAVKGPVVCIGPSAQSAPLPSRLIPDESAPVPTSPQSTRN